MTFYNPNVTDAGPLTLADFRQMKKGHTIRLHYNDYNKGEFLWIHDRVEGDRVFGLYLYEGDNIHEAKIGDYLYEFEGYVARGSGAEIVCRRMPKDNEMTREEEDEFYET